MATVHFTSALNRFNAKLRTLEVKGGTIREVLAEIEMAFPGLRDYLIDETGTLRTHVNIFINNRLISDPKKLNDVVAVSDKIHIIQALSGG